MSTKSSSRLLDLSFYDNNTLSIPLDFINSEDLKFLQDLITEIVDELQDDYVLKMKSFKTKFFVSIYLKNKKGYIYVKDKNFYKYLNSMTFMMNKPNIPKMLKFSRVSVNVIDDKRMANILRCRNLPSEITEEDLKNIFKDFASDPDTIQIRFIKGNRVPDTFPYVSVDKNNIAFIVFDPETTDARFALLLNRELTINIGDNSYELKFNHSFRTEKDITSELRRRKTIFQQNFKLKEPIIDSIYKKDTKKLRDNLEIW